MSNQRETLSKSVAFDGNSDAAGESYGVAPELYLTAPNAGQNTKAFATANMRYGSVPRPPLNEPTGDMTNSPFVDRRSDQRQPEISSHMKIREGAAGNIASGNRFK